jgi:hypothetical protein
MNHPEQTNAFDPAKMECYLQQGRRARSQAAMEGLHGMGAMARFVAQQFRKFAQAWTERLADATPGVDNASGEACSGSPAR